MKGRAQSRTFPPRWFRLSKYEGIEGFGAYEWYHHLVARVECGSRLVWHTGEHDFIFVENILSRLRRNPLLLCEEVLSVARPLHIQIRDVKERTGVRSITFEALQGKDTDRPREFRFGPGGVDWRREPVFHSVYSENTAALLIIDLNLPDSILHRQFRSCLSDLRALERPSLPKHYGPDLRKWRDVKLLPCLDLLLWGMQQNRKPSQSELRRALFPLEPSKADVVRKTTLPLAFNFVGSAHSSHRGLLHRLAVEVAYESRERERAREKNRGANRKKVK